MIVLKTLELLSITLMGAFREILGAGTIFGYKLWDFKIEYFANASGALFTYGMFIAVFALVSTLISRRKAKKAKNSQTEEVAA